MAAATRTLATRNFSDFSRFMAPPEYDFNWHHTDVLWPAMDKFISGEWKRLIIEMPPRHGKSEAASRNLPAKIFGNYPNASVMACSHTQSLASDMNRDVQRIMDTEKYAELFPNISLSETNVRSLSGKARRNSDLFDIPGYRGSYKAAGVGVAIAGRGFNYGIIDDPHRNREEANSPTSREAVWRWFAADFMTRMAKNAGLLITSTRWNEDDLIGRIKRKMLAGEIEPYKIITLPALSTDASILSGYDSRRNVGEALWTWFKKAEEFEMMQRTSPLDFYSLFQQDPRGEGAAEWGPECFPASMWFDEWPKGLQFLTFGLDPSKGRNASHGDYSAIVALARSPDGTLWVEADLARRTTSRIADDSIEFVSRIQEETTLIADGFGVESDQFQELLADQIIARSGSAWFSGLVRKMTTNNVPKEVRIRRLTPSITGGKFRFRATPGTRLLVRQLEQFPNGDHDDGPDGLEYAQRLGNELWNAGKAEYGADYASLKPESRW